jgi:hypothetical protein
MRNIFNFNVVKKEIKEFIFKKNVFLFFGYNKPFRQRNEYKDTLTT